MVHRVLSMQGPGPSRQPYRAHRGLVPAGGGVGLPHCQMHRLTQVCGPFTQQDLMLLMSQKVSSQCCKLQSHASSALFSIVCTLPLWSLTSCMTVSGKLVPVSHIPTDTESCSSNMLKNMSQSSLAGMLLTHSASRKQTVCTSTLLPDLQSSPACLGIVDVEGSGGRIVDSRGSFGVAVGVVGKST